MFQHDPDWITWTDLVTWAKVAAYALFAAIGGFMGYLMRVLDKRQKPQWGRALVEAVAAGFVGVLTLLCCIALGLSPAWTGVVVGVCGWLGANVTILMLEKVVLKKLGIERAEPHQLQERANDRCDPTDQ